MASIIGFGEISGALIFNELSDVVGRRIIMISGSIIWIIVMIVILFNQSVQFQIALL